MGPLQHEVFPFPGRKLVGITEGSPPAPSHPGWGLVSDMLMKANGHTSFLQVTGVKELIG